MSKRKTIRKGQCFGTLIWAIIGLATLFVPFAIHAEGIIFTHQVMPFLSSDLGSISLESVAMQVLSTFSLFGLELSTEIFELVSKISFYGLYAFFGIFAFDFIFSFLLLIFGGEVLRKIAKIITIFAGIAFILIAITSLINLIGVINLGLSFGVGIIEVVKTSGAIFYLVAFIFSLMFIKKQFGWFAKEDLDD